MDFQEEMRVYVERWKAVEAVRMEERRRASIELRWKQLDAAYGMAKGLGLLRSDPSEMGVFERWVRLKEMAENRIPETSHR